MKQMISLILLSCLIVGVVRAQEPTPLVTIPDGKFVLGLPEQAIWNFLTILDQHYGKDAVDITVFDDAVNDQPVRVRSYQIEAYPVSVAQYTKFLNSSPGASKHYHTEMADPATCGIIKSEHGFSVAAGRADFPIVYVTWFDASAYAAWAGMRLPTEAEWERAARGQIGRLFPWGDKLDLEKLNHGRLTKKGCVPDPSDGFTNTSPVNAFPRGQTPKGVANLAGNVWEWTADWYRPDTYANMSAINPAGPDRGIRRVIRGGSFRSSGSELSSVYRGKQKPDMIADDIGFRCVKDISAK